jgi:hypothetical protein
MGTSREDSRCWLPIDGIPGASLLVSAAPVSRARTTLSALRGTMPASRAVAMSALRGTMPSPRVVAIVIIGAIAATFLVIFVIASVLYIKGGFAF